MSDDVGAEPSPNGEVFRSEGDVNLSAQRVAWTESNIGIDTAHWLADDAKYFLRQSLSTPCLDVLTSCHGSYIQDLEGRRYLDFHGNNVHQVGFGNPKVVDAIIEQMRTLSFCTRRFTNIPAIRLAKKLVELVPGDLNKVLFTPGGTSAIGTALKLARIATGRFKTVSMWESFHGASLDAISVGGEALFRNGIGPLLPGTEHVPPPDPAQCPLCGDTCTLKCADYLEYVLEKEGDVAAVIAEPVRCTPAIPPQAYWPRIRAACDRHGTLLIFDEIPTCLGRTGALFVHEHFGVTPDILCIGKGLGGGVFPLAAIIARESLDVAPDRALGHYTHEKNPVACAAALAAIEFIEKEDLLEHVRALGAYTLERLRAFQTRYPIIREVRGLGLLLGVELAKNGRPAVDEAEAMMYGALSRGLSFKLTMGNILTLTPPLTITREEMDTALDILDGCFATLEK